MKNSILLILFAFYCSSLFSQDLDRNYYNSFQQKLFGRQFMIERRLKGNQFVTKWADSDILLENNNIVRGQKVRYNGYLGAFIWLTENNQQVVLENCAIKEVYMKTSTDSLLVFKKIVVQEASDTVFAQLLSNSKINLYGVRMVVMGKRNSRGEEQCYIFKDTAAKQFLLCFCFAK